MRVLITVALLFVPLLANSDVCRERLLSGKRNYVEAEYLIEQAEHQNSRLKYVASQPNHKIKTVCGLRKEVIYRIGAATGYYGAAALDFGYVLYKCNDPEMETVKSIRIESKKNKRNARKDANRLLEELWINCYQ